MQSDRSNPQGFPLKNRNVPAETFAISCAVGLLAEWDSDHLASPWPLWNHIPHSPSLASLPEADDLHLCL